MWRTLLILSGLGVSAPAQPSLDEILARLADNQERAVEARRQIVYRQDTFVRLLRTDGKLGREERRRYTVLPGAKGSEKKLEQLDGRYLRKGRLVTYDKPHSPVKDSGIDGDLIEGLTHDLVEDSESRDGIAKEQFPLTRAEQAHYRFHLDGSESMGGQPAYHIRFEPKSKDSDRPWSGEVWVDSAEFQPLRVVTTLAEKIPLAVKVMLGTDIKQLGFSITYRKVDDGLWFPATYGSEFNLKVLFGYKRNITLNLTNSEFRRAKAESRITFDPAPAAP